MFEPTGEAGYTHVGNMRAPHIALYQIVIIPARVTDQYATPSRCFAIPVRPGKVWTVVPLARVAKLAYAPDLGSGVLGRAGSSPASRTTKFDTNFPSPHPPRIGQWGNAFHIRATDWQPCRARVPATARTRIPAISANKPLPRVQVPLEHTGPRRRSAGWRKSASQRSGTRLATSGGQMCSQKSTMCAAGLRPDVQQGSGQVRSIVDIKVMSSTPRSGLVGRASDRGHNPGDNA